MEEAAGEFVVDQKIGRLAPVNARNRRAHHVAALAVGPKQKAGGSSHRPRRVSKRPPRALPSQTAAGYARSAQTKRPASSRFSQSSRKKKVSRQVGDTTSPENPSATVPGSKSAPCPIRA